MRLVGLSPVMLISISLDPLLRACHECFAVLSSNGVDAQRLPTEAMQGPPPPPPPPRSKRGGAGRDSLETT